MRMPLAPEIPTMMRGAVTIRFITFAERKKKNQPSSCGGYPLACKSNEKNSPFRVVPAAVCWDGSGAVARDTFDELGERLQAAYWHVR